jgi:hypothetical protein
MASSPSTNWRSTSSIAVVDVKTDGSSFEAGIPKVLFEVRVNTGLGRNHFVVNKDGHRLLVVTPVEETINEPLQVLVNWR